MSRELPKQTKPEVVADNATPDCKTHPDAPHGFDRNASHNADRYVCECESWEPPKREWVDLDHIEIANLWSEHKEVYSFGFAVQELFKKKNPRNDLG